MHKKSILPVLFLTLLLDMIGVGMLIPVIPSLFTDPTSSSFLLSGYSEHSRYLIAGLITALFGLMQFLASPILGELSDLYGRKKLLALGVGVLAISNLVFAFGIEIRSIILILVSRMVAGIAGANFSIAQAAVADVTEPKDRARNFGMIGAAFGIGFILGPLLGGWIAGSTGIPSLPFLFAGILGIINLSLVFFRFPETHVPTSTHKGSLPIFKAFQNIRQAMTDHDVKPAYGASFLSMLGFAFFTSFSSVYLAEQFSFSETETGIYFALVGIWIILGQTVLVRILSSQYSERKLLLWAFPILGASIALQGLVPHEAYLYATMPFMAGSMSIISTALPAIISKGVSSERQGAALGINGSLQALSNALAPMAAGIVSGALGLTGTFLVGALFVFIAAYVMRSHKHP